MQYQFSDQYNRKLAKLGGPHCLKCFDGLSKEGCYSKFVAHPWFPVWFSLYHLKYSARVGYYIVLQIAKVVHILFSVIC